MLFSLSSIRSRAKKRREGKKNLLEEEAHTLTLFQPPPSPVLKHNEMPGTD